MKKRLSIYLASSACLPAGLYILLALISFFLSFLMVVRRTIISGSAGPIFAIFSPNDCILGVDDRSGPLFPISQGTLPWQPILRKNGKFPSFVALSFRNGMGYRYLRVNDAAISCIELTEIICARLVRHSQKTGVFSRIYQDILD